jgi:glycosyltransferase involved in cell wall biosynthesis
VCFASRLERTKGAHVLVEAVALLRPTHPDLRLLVAGAGPAEPGLRRQVSGLGLGDRVLLLGRVDHADLPAVHAAADLFALPALAPEGLPLSLAEAMASGLPVVASSVGGVAEAVEDGVTGVLTPPGDAAALAAAVAGLLADGEGRVAMGARARQAAAARFDAVAVVDAVEGVVAGAVGVAR